MDFLKLGLGGMSYTAEDATDELTATAGSASLGAGYDIRVGTNLSVTLWLNSLGSAPVDFELNGVPVQTDDFSLNLVQIGVGVTWH